MATIKSQNTHLTEVAIPSYWTMPNQPNPSANIHNIHKPKHPLPAGVSKMKTFGPPFSLDFTMNDASTHTNSSSLLSITMDNVFDATFSVASRTLIWCPEDPDEGVFVTRNADGDIILEDVTHLKREMTGLGEVAKGGGLVNFVRGRDIRDADGRQLDFDTFMISPDMKHLLLFSERKAQWRYSSFSKVWIHSIAEKKTTQIGYKAFDTASISTAHWSKGETHVSFVEGNNLYIIKDPDQPTLITPVTTTGNQNIFNGVPDWVYEEEVFSGDTAHWWSPDGKRVLYLELDETQVKTYSFPIYNPTNINGKASLYPQSVNMKYPKPGTPNPVVSVYVYEVHTGRKYELTSPPTPQVKTDGIESQTADFALRAAGNDVLVTEVNWVNDRTVMLKETNRWSDAMRYMIFDCTQASMAAGQDNGTLSGVISRRVTTAKSGGWIQAEMDVHVVPGNGDYSTAYVDVIALRHGYRHIAYFDEATRSEPVFLTTGEWEVDKILFVGNDRIYFTAAYPKPAYRHVFYVDIPKSVGDVKATSTPQSLTDTSQPGFYSASFDPKGNYYTLNARGPSLPSSRVLSLRDSTFELVLEDNKALSTTLAKYVKPQIAYYNITTNDGSTISVVELRPYDFDDSGNTRYPVLVNVYGGPNSQMVQTTFKMDGWSTYLTCSLGYIVVTMDGRGTGFMGRDYRDTVTWRLGEMEAKDVIEGAQAIRRLPYVAQSKVGIWGWSYGGYLTAKVVEKNSGAFDLGMSVAPVTRWEFYDSIYTERYMKTPQLNKYGYENSSIHITPGFHNTQFLLAQGSGDDNVHFQNTAHLLDLLQGAKVRNFWYEMFPDSSHSINKRGANRELYEFLTKFLVNNWGAGGKRLLRYENDKGLSTVY
ncbi:hypothetical protein CBS101457_003922 [Exobasidium rhododendri]|nr:hypothetical protein CBS101457_003922 [Exobasidium rhododendri]